MTASDFQEEVSNKTYKPHALEVPGGKELSKKAFGPDVDDDNFGCKLVSSKVGMVSKNDIVAGIGGGRNGSDVTGGCQDGDIFGKYPNPRKEPGSTGAKLGEALRYIVDHLPEWFQYFDKEGRSAFTQTTAEYLFNNCDGGVAGIIVTCKDFDWCNILWCEDVWFGNFKYKAVAFPAYHFSRYNHHGDGGYLNWAIYGYFDKNGGEVTFDTRSGYSRNTQIEYGVEATC